MTTTRIEFQAGRIARLVDASDLAEVLFAGNRNQQHAFLVLWFTLCQAPHGLVPNFAAVVRGNRVSRRTLERTRAKLRRLGLIERVSRFNARYGGREGWVLSTRFERGLRLLAEKVEVLRGSEARAVEKDRFLIDLADARRSVPQHSSASPAGGADS